MSDYQSEVWQGHTVTHNVGLLSSAHKISVSKLYRAMSIDRPFLYPNCSYARILLGGKDINYCCVHNVRSFRNAVRNEIGL
jgi:hypothetical protein